MGDLSGKHTSQTGPAVFGPVSGLYVQVNENRTIFVTTPVRGSSIPVYGKITAANGSLAGSFEDTTRRSSVYGKEVAIPLAAGSYTLANRNRRRPPVHRFRGEVI